MVNEAVRANEAKSQFEGEKRVVEEVLRFLAQRGWQDEADGFFAQLVTHIAEALGVSYAFVDRVLPEDSGIVETIALYAHGEITTNIKYSLVGTPCENVISRGLCRYMDNIQSLFPDDDLLVQMDAESYVGIPLWSASGGVIGLIALVDTKPLQNSDLAGTVLQIVALRASAELERQDLLSTVLEDRRRFEDFAKASSDWFWEMDEHLRFSYFSDRYTAITGIPTSLMIGKLRQETGIEDLVDSEVYERHLADLAAYRPFRNFVHARRRGDGSLIYMSVSGTPHFDANGDFKGYRGVGRDITEQVEIEEARSAAIREAERANAAKSHFLASMSHDLRTPLNAILGFSDILKRQLFGAIGNEKYLEYSTDIHNSARYLLELVDDLLDISTIEAGKFELSRTLFSISELLDECLQYINPAAMQKNLDVERNFDLTNPFMFADKRAIKQVLLNIVSNSVKFTPSNGRILISVKRTETDTCFEIKDNGAGIDPAKLSVVTDTYLRADSSSYEVGKGWGLGLAIAKALVELHNGRLKIESEVGRGTTVAVFIPNVTSMTG